VTTARRYWERAHVCACHCFIREDGVEDRDAAADTSRGNEGCLQALNAGSVLAIFLEYHPVPQRCTLTSLSPCPIRWHGVQRKGGGHPTSNLPLTALSPARHPCTLPHVPRWTTWWFPIARLLKPSLLGEMHPGTYILHQRLARCLSAPPSALPQPAYLCGDPAISAPLMKTEERFSLQPMLKGPSAEAQQAKLNFFEFPPRKGWPQPCHLCGWLLKQTLLLRSQVEPSLSHPWSVRSSKPSIPFSAVCKHSGADKSPRSCQLGLLQDSFCDILCSIYLLRALTLAAVRALLRRRMAARTPHCTPGYSTNIKNN